MDTQKTIFKVGDRVFVGNYGWGSITCVKKARCSIMFDCEENVVSVLNKLISFQEYILYDFSQERPINYKDYIGKWGKFYDKDHIESLICKFGKLERIQNNNTYKFKPEDSPGYYEFFEPLTEEQIKILGLTDKKCR